MKKKRMRGRAACAVLAAVLLAAPAAALALETAPFAPGMSVQQERPQDAECIEPFGTRRAYLGVTASRAWMRQARIGGLLLNLRLFTPQGDAIPFEEKLNPAQTGGKDICLYMRAQASENGIIMQLDQYAVDVLTRVGITELVVVDEEWYVWAQYQVAELAAVRAALALSEGEQLCVSGEDDPVTIVSEDGVRRQVNL